MDNPDKTVTQSDTEPVSSPAAESGASVPSPTTSLTRTAWQGAFAAYGSAFEHIKKNPQPALVIVGAYAIVSLIAVTLEPSDMNAPGAWRDFMILMFLYFVVGMIFLLATFTYALAIADKKIISVKDFMRLNSTKFYAVFVASLVSSLFIGLSALLFLIPIIWTIPWFFFSVYIAADKNILPFNAVKESKRIAQNHKAKVWGIIGFALLLTLLSGLFSFLPVIGQLLSDITSSAIGILITGAAAILYRWLQQEQPEPASQLEKPAI